MTREDGALNQMSEATQISAECVVCKPKGDLER